MTIVATIVEARYLSRFPIDCHRPMWDQVRPEHVPQKGRGNFSMRFGGLHIEVHRDKKGWRILRKSSNEHAERELMVTAFEEVRSILRALERTTDPEQTYACLYRADNSVLDRIRKPTIH